MNDQILLEVKGLTKQFSNGKRTHVAVNDVSFSVREGETFGLVGESGCGKTTTGRTIVGLYPPTSGEIFFEGENIADLKGAARRKLCKKMQMIYQDPVASLNPRMTVGEIVAEGLVIGGEKDKKEIVRRVEETLLEVGLSAEAMGRYPHEFSGGQRQRIGIARALIMSPKLIIADEPVSALDVSVQAQVINLLGELKEKKGLTVLFIAHDLSLVKYFCDRVAVMYAGEIVEIASSRTLFENPLHEYTRALLSAIPVPDPRRARETRRLPFEEKIGETTGAGTSLKEVAKNHFVRKRS
ncbi:MAG: ABC transporter ATP-binding protein [Clostridia bacterium]|nr:ABC transporter ATP-binding protein [Clostridia bacterium]